MSKASVENAKENGENFNEEELEALSALFPGRVLFFDDDGGRLEEIGAHSNLISTVQIFVSVHLEAPITVEARVLDESEGSDEACGGPSFQEVPNPLRPSFERTISGRWLTSFQVSALPALDLQLTRPPTDSAVPKFSLGASWLSASDLQLICQGLDSLALENEGMPVISLWVDWLEQRMLEMLAMTEKVVLLDGDNFENFDPRGVPLALGTEEIIYTILRYEAEKEEEAFRNGSLECGICLDERPGTKLIRFPRCLHHFCLDCLTDYCKRTVAEGTVQYLSCPGSECGTGFPPELLRQLLSADEFQRWESLSLQKFLEAQTDLDWCPRCQLVALKESDHETSLLARCPHCNFAFCTRCRDGFHQGSKCKKTSDKLAELEMKMRSSSETTKQALQRQMQQLKADWLNELVLERVSKGCPGCKTRIEKISGCNKMTCTACGQHMCWVCGRNIKDYSHFSDRSCPLSDGAVGPQAFFDPFDVRRPEPPLGYFRMQHALRRNPRLRQNLVPCPVCRQRNLKLERNNHIRCWCCKNNFCCRCNSRIVGVVTAHFGSNKCPQHSDD